MLIGPRSGIAKAAFALHFSTLRCVIVTCAVRVRAPSFSLIQSAPSFSRRSSSAFAAEAADSVLLTKKLCD